MKPSLAALAFGVLFSGCAVRSPQAALLPTPPRSLAPATLAPASGRGDLDGASGFHRHPHR